MTIEIITDYNTKAVNVNVYQRRRNNNGCGHTWHLTLVKGFNRGKKDVKKLYYSKTHYLT